MGLTTVDGDQWSLNLIELFLKSSSQKNWQDSVSVEITALELGLPSQSSEERFQLLMRLDHKIGSVWSAINLFSLQLSEHSVDSDMEFWLIKVSRKLVDQMEEFCHSISGHNAFVPDIIRLWAELLQVERQFTNLKNSYRDIGKGSASSSSGLLERRQIDPEANAFHIRLKQNGLNQSSAEFTEEHANESRAYFDSLLLELGARSAWLSDIRQFEMDQFRICELDWRDALELVCSSFKFIHLLCETYLNDIIKNQHIRFLKEQNQPDMCVDTPFGSFVQLYFDGSLNGLVRLVHELGHAIHQRLHRESTMGVIPLTEVVSETWAMAFENRFLEHLRTCCLEWVAQVDAFRGFQRIEMSNRHRMLTRFEHSLHAKQIQNEADIDELWLQVNHRFYGPNIHFETEFQSAWKDVGHIFIAPFYLSVYAEAKERADLCDLSSMIQAYCSKRN